MHGAATTTSGAASGSHATTAPAVEAIWKVILSENALAYPYNGLAHGQGTFQLELRGRRGTSGDLPPSLPPELFDGTPRAQATPVGSRHSRVTPPLHTGFVPGIWRCSRRVPPTGSCIGHSAFATQELARQTASTGLHSLRPQKWGLEGQSGKHVSLVMHPLRQRRTRDSHRHERSCRTFSPHPCSLLRRHTNISPPSRRRAGRGLPSLE